MDLLNDRYVDRGQSPKVADSSLFGTNKQQFPFPNDGVLLTSSVRPKANMLLLVLGGYLFLLD